MCLKAVLEDSEKMILKSLGIQPGILIATFNLSLTYREKEKKKLKFLEKFSDCPK